MMANESELQVITKAKELCEYVMTITQKSPKQFRFTFVTRLQNLSLDVIENLYRANEVLVGGRHGSAHLPERLAHQRKVIVDVRLLAYFAELAMRQQCILPKQYERIAKVFEFREADSVCRLPRPTRRRRFFRSNAG
jgi:hypothetical protein